MPAMDEALGPVYQTKSYSSFRVYVTDSSGVVIYDSLPTPDNNEGQNYGRWNDVYLTLKGEYGARSTLRDYQRRDGSVMYVAQPIRSASGDIIGVVSVGKPVASVLPYLDDTRNRMLITALLISIAALILAGLVAWWLKQSITLVTQYTRALAEDTKKPYFYLGRELNSLTDTIETMKHRLENRAYVTDYVHTLTHELKSPLTAIRASSELLEDDGLDGNQLDNEDRQMLIETVGEQSMKMQQLIDRLLLLAKVEQPTFKLNRQLTPLLPLLQSLIRDNSAKQQQQNLKPINVYIDDRRVTDTVNLPAEVLAATSVFADQFWLIQVLQNVLDNAIHFAKSTIEISLHSTSQNITIDIFNDGKPLPDYAVAKAFDRYFSLSHQSQPSSQTTNQTDIHYLNTDLVYPTTESRQTDNNRNTLKKGTGLGLTLVKQVIEHHGGQVTINNVHAKDDKAGTNKTSTGKNPRSGVMVSITLPLA
jgi:two-component system sensor histidine kinase CreC